MIILPTIFPKISRGTPILAASTTMYAAIPPVIVSPPPGSKPKIGSRPKRILVPGMDIALSSSRLMRRSLLILLTCLAGTDVFIKMQQLIFS